MMMTELVFLGINDIGQKVYDWLTDRDDVKITALLTESDQLGTIETLQPDLILSAGYRHIVPQEILEIPKKGAVNFHKSYLPYNRGANPNVWSIIEDSPAGVSLHYMTSEVDAGPIIDRRSVPVYPDDNAKNLYERLENAQFDQFREVWSSIRDDEVETISQEENEATVHKKEEFVDLWEIDTDQSIIVEDFLKKLRALTFPPYKNAYFTKNGKKYHVEIKITQKTQNVANGNSEKKLPTYTENGDN
jgi:methionyl-tRNA formyltransferase